MAFSFVGPNTTLPLDEAILHKKRLLAGLLPSHCTQGEWYESITKTGQYSQYPAGKPWIDCQSILVFQLLCHRSMWLSANEGYLPVFHF